MKTQKLSVSLGQHSQAGRKPLNQDFYGAITPTGHALALKGISLAIADGISSSAISGQAAQTAVKSFLEDYYAAPDTWTAQRSCKKVIEAANAWLYSQNARSAETDKNRGLVCTFSALIIKGRNAHIFHIGDSRIYRLSKGALECLTRDHIYSVSEDESYLSRALGIDYLVEIDYRTLVLEEGDVFLLTTDGIHEHMDTQHVLKTIAEAPSLEDAASEITQAALDAGSADNLTLQIVRVDTLPPTSGADVVDQAASLAVLSALKAGDEIDGLRILRQLHSSSRSAVYLAATQSEDHVALKIPSAELRQNDGHMRRFMLEEWIARRITNDHVLAPAHMEMPQTALYVATRYIEGQTLRQWMADTPAPDLPKVRTIIGQIAAGLRAFHRKEMLHQDVRPENIMIDADGTVKIIDFGSVSVPGVEEAAPGTAGHMPGTYQYTAPEYLSGDAVSWRSDQFSLGVIAYEMLTGKLPYGTAVAKVTNRTDQRRLTYTPARDYTPAVPLWLDAALRRAVHPDPLKRYDALSEFIRDISEPRAVSRANRHIPLAERSPATFWKSVSGILAVAVIALLIDRLSG